jgi:hypothetical protein
MCFLIHKLFCQLVLFVLVKHENTGSYQFENLVLLDFFNKMTAIPVFLRLLNNVPPPPSEMSRHLNGIFILTGD